MTGPPTPPVTSQVEIDDAARATAEQAAAVSPPPKTRPEFYQDALPTLISLTAKREVRKLVDAAERLDFYVASDRHPSRLLVSTPLILGHLILDDTSAARFAFNRLAENIQSLPFSRALMALIVVTTNREHAMVYDQVQLLANLVTQTDFFDKDLAAIATELLDHFQNAFRQRTFSVLSKAYTSLHLQLASIYLGMPAQEVLAVAKNNGWNYDADQEVVVPEPAQSQSVNVVPEKISSLETFHFVSSTVAALEM